jgi:rhodanese-related sulfurtransferase
MVDQVSPQQALKLLHEDAGSVLLLDVREDDERETARIEPSIHIPMARIADRIDELPKDRKIIVYCHHGSRSMMVAGFLEGEGFDDISNLSGGIDAWSVKADPKVPRYD